MKKILLPIEIITDKKTCLRSVIKFCTVMALLVLPITAAPAHATTIRWDLSDVTVPNSRGIAITGFFDYDTGATSYSTSFPVYSISVASPCCLSFGNFTLTQSNSFIQYGGNGAISIMNNGATSSFYEAVSLGTYGAFDGTSGQLLILSPYLSGIAVNNSGFNKASILQGQLIASVSPVPLPAALPLFASGLLGLGALARRQMRKNAA